MKKRVTALILCTVMLMVSLPVSPVFPDTSVTASAVSVEGLQKLYDELSENKDDWGTLYIDTRNLETWYAMAQKVLENPDKYDQDYIDGTEASLRAAYDQLKYHTLSVSVNPTSASVNVGASVSLRSVLNPENAADGVTWKSDNEAVASVSEKGVVTVHKFSSSLITVTAESNGHSASCKIRTLNPLAGVKLTAPASLYVGQTQTLKAQVLGKDSTAATTDDYILTWDSSNTYAADISDSGELTANHSGTTVITVTAKCGTASFSAKATVTVLDLVPITALQAQTVTTSGKLVMNIGETLDFKVSITPTNASIKNLQWTSSDTSVLSVTDKGYSGSTAVASVTAKKAGTVTLKFAAKDGTGKYGYVTVTVLPKISSITAEKMKVVAPNVKTETVNVTILPKDAGNQVLSWSSSDPDICDVDYSGRLLPKSLGVCTIYIKTTDGSNLSAECKVRVASLATAVSISQSTCTLNTGASVSLKATVKTNDGSSYSDFIEWTSENTKIASVDQNGKVTANYPGTVIIRARAIDGTERSAVCAVTVKQPVIGVSLPTEIKVGVGAQYTLKPTFNPTYATNKTVTWSTSNSAVATVSSAGVVTGKAVGTAVISCKTADGGYIAKCTVKVIIPTQSVALDKTRASVYVGNNITLTGTVSPANATDKTLTWSSSDTSVATVSQSGVVTGVKGGTCTITCKNSGGQSAFCNITVIQKATGITLNRSTLSLYTGQVYTLIPTVLPSTATNKQVTWSSTNTKIVSVNTNGVVTGVAAGTAVVIAKTVDGGFVASCSVTVTKKVDVTAIKLNKTSLSLNKGDQFLLDVTVTPSNASEKGVTWASNNKNVATVSSTGVVTAVGNGSAIISATAKDGGFVAKCTVNISSQVTGVRVSPNEYRIAKGSSKTLIVNVFPTDATNKKVVWSSSNPKIVSVNANGVATALAGGVATVTATTVDGGYTSSCDFTVYTPVTGVDLTSTNVTLPKGNTALLTAKVLPTNASNNSLRWSSSDSSVVTVNTAGQIKGVKVGSAVITVSTVDGNYSDTCVVSVVQLAESVALDYTSLTLYAGKTKTLGAKLKPSTTSNKKIIWSSTNTAVAKVDSTGKITAVAGGSAIIKATSGDKQASASCRVTVIQYPTKITLNTTGKGLRIGQSYALTATVLPKTATYRNVTWVSSNTKVVTVSANGTIKGIAKGTATVTAYSADKKISASCKVNVIRGVSGVSLNYTSVTLVANKKFTLVPTIKPSDAYYKQVTWQSSNYDVADVNASGTVTTKSPGYAEITVRTKDGGYKAVCRVLVVQPVTSLTLNKKDVYIELGSTLPLTAAIKPSNATNKTVNWSTNNKSIATVSSTGAVKGVKIGTAVITAKAALGGKTASCTVHVVRKVKSITLNRSEMVLYLGKSTVLKPYIAPSDATVKTVKWYSSNTAVLRVDSKGALTPVKPGKAVITAVTTDGGLKASCTVSVEIPATSFKISNSALTLYSGKTYQLTYAIAPANTTNKTVTWSSSNPKVATVYNGKITAVGGGTATVTAKTSNGITRTCAVKVLKSVSSVSLNVSSATLYTGSVYKLVASVLPSDASNKKVTWSSSNRNVATVDESGSVKAVKAGTAVITAVTADGGLKASCRFTVLQHVTSVKLDKTSLVIPRGSEAKLSATVLPNDATNKAHKWESSDSSIVSVSADGELTANAVGEATVSVLTDDGGKKAVCRITVYEKVTDMSIDITEKILYLNEKVTISATVSPSDATNKNVNWSSSAPAVANVDSNGVVTALKVGTATITAKTADGGLTRTCKITVRAHVTGLALSQPDITVKRGDSYQLVAYIEPANSFEKGVVWRSENEQVASVENGKVTALSRGEAVIVATSVDGGFTASCIVTVTQPVEGIVLSENEMTAYTGLSASLEYSILPDNATNKNVVWASSDKSVAVVENGVVKGISGGTALITVKTVDGGYLDYCFVTVNIAAEEIRLNASSLTLARGEKAKITATVLPEDTYDKTVTWTSDNEDIALVDGNGVVTAVSAGTAKIICESAIGNAKAELSVTVYEPVTEITVTGEKDILWVGDTETLEAQVKPDNATDKTVSWKSSEPSVASVDENGKLTAVSAGTADITATSSDGRVSDSFTVTVRQQVTEVTLNKTEIILNEGESEVLSASALPENAYNKTLIFESENGEIATVDENGKIAAVSKGECYVTVTAEGTTVTNRCLVRVIRPVTGVNISNKQLIVKKGETFSLSASASPADASDTSIVWTSSSPETVSVGENGKFTALKGGTAFITAQTSNSEISAECKVTVEVMSTGVALDMEKVELWEGETVTLSCTLSPDDATGASVIWTSDSDSVATVENGKITAKTAGTAVITATASDSGLSASCTVKVSKKTEQVRLDKTEITLENGESLTLQAEVLPADATYKEVTWSSSDKDVAVVDANGTVTAKGVGTAIITAKTVQGEKGASCTVTVTQKPSEITLNKDSLVLYEGESETLTAVLAPESTTFKELIWESSDEKIAAVENGKVTAVSLGTAVITVKSAVDESVTARCEVKVLRGVTGVTLDKTALTVEVGEEARLSATVLPDGASSTAVTWSSSDKNVAAVDSYGNITAKGVGTAVITVKTVQGLKSASCTVTVTQKPSEITLNKKSLTLYEGESEALTAAFLPENTTLKELIWESSDEKIATVENGKVTAVSLGTTVITAKSAADESVTARCEIKVLRAVKSVTLDKKELTVRVGDEATLTAAVGPEGASNTKVIWASSDDRIARIDENGNITALSEGTAKITVTTVDGGYTDVCFVIVGSEVNEP